MKNLAGLFTFCLFILSNITIQSQWVQTSGPASGAVTSLVCNGTNLVAAVDYRGFYVSTNNGSNWSSANNGFNNAHVYSMILNSGTLYTGTDSGVFITSNNGANWKLANNGLIDNPVLSFAVVGNNILAGTRNGIWHSTDNGTGWTYIGLKGYIYSFAVNGNNIFAATDTGVYISTNNGTSWISAGLSDTTTLALAISGNNIYAGTFYGVFLSTDSGNSWTHLNGDQSNYYINSITISGNNIYAGAMYDGGVFLSTDNGTNWSSIRNRLPLYQTNIYSLSVNGTNVYAATSYGVYQITNNSTDWINIGLPIAYVSALAVNGNDIFSGAGGVFKSTNSGTNWEQLGSYYPQINSITVEGNNVYAATSHFGVYCSTDYGISWLWHNIYISRAVSALTHIGSNIFAASYPTVKGAPGGILLSTDHGLNWTGIGLYDKSVYCLAVVDTILFAGTHYYGVYLSSDNGSNWAQVSNWLTTADVYAITNCGNYIYAATEGSGIYRSSDKGTNWIQVNNGLTCDSVYSLTVSGNNVFAGTSNGGVFLTRNNGANWEQIGLTDYSVHSIIAGHSDIFAGTYGGGVWKRSLLDFGLPVELTSFKANISNHYINLSWHTATELNNMGFNVERSINKSDWTTISFVKGNGTTTSTIAYSYLDKSIQKEGKYYYRLKQLDNNGSYKYSPVVEINLNAPSVFTLDQNYPNPFNPNTLISYSLPTSSNIKLIIYNTLGQTIKTLESGYKSAGNYSVSFNASSLPSGIYFYKLEAGQCTQIKKMILMK
jgi:photosystem II stability/assembly factor-like uncharacterized protein